jgi:2-oxoglutarate dehydrogenase E1 component
MSGFSILETAFNGANAAYIAAIYARWLSSPDSVDSTFAELFSSLNDDEKSILGDYAGASWSPRRWEDGAEMPEKTKGLNAGTNQAGLHDEVLSATKDSLRAAIWRRS